MSIEKKYEELIESSYIELEKLKSEVTQLEDIRENIENLIGSNNVLPPMFLELYQKIETLSVAFTTGIDEITRKYLSHAHKYFVDAISELENGIINLGIQIDIIAAVDFTRLFEDLQKVFIAQTRADLAIELKKFEEKTKDLQTTIDELNTQIERLANIDLEKHFDEIQKKFADIFGAINSIELTLTTTIQTLTRISQSLVTIETTLETNQKETRQLLNALSEATEKHLAEQDKDATKNLELLDSIIKSLSEQSELLIKEAKTNRIIQITGLTVILIIFIYIALK